MPTVAISLCRSERTAHYATAAHVARRIVERLLVEPLDRSMILNINVPNVPLAELRGIVTTRLGHRHRSEAVVRANDPRGRPVYWIGFPSSGPSVLVSPYGE